MPGFSLPALLRAVAVWLLFILAETVQGGLRQVLTSPEFEYAVRQASVFVGALILFAITWFSLGWMRIRTTREALSVGLAWVALTLVFEVGLGRLLGVGWDRILADYDLLHGGLMPLGLVAMALTPWAVRRLQAPAPRSPGIG
jgi:hypothetical protein